MTTQDAFRRRPLTATHHEALRAALAGPLLQRCGSYIRPAVGRWRRPVVERLVALGLMRHARSSRTAMSMVVLTDLGIAVAGGAAFDPLAAIEAPPPPPEGAAPVRLADRLAP